jgi:steroid delta-isomerase-like uncharacterized protein
VSDAAKVPDSRTVVEAYLVALGTADPDAIVAWVTADFWNEHTSALGTSSRGRSEYRARLPGFLGEFRDLSYDIEDMVSEADKVVVAYTMQARWRGERPIAIRGVFRFRVRDGLIAHRADYWDGSEFLRQTGQV